MKDKIELLLTRRTRLRKELDATEKEISHEAQRLRGIVARVQTSPQSPLVKLVAARKGRKLGKVAPKYRDKTGQTWTGRGSKPRWLQARLKAGAKLDQFLIKKAA